MSHQGPTPLEPEYLSSADPADRGTRRPRARRAALLAAGAVVVAGLAGGAAWAWSAYASTGAQPSEALPAGTLGYAAIDLDPSGQQKVEALGFLRQFPAVADEVDLAPDADLRRQVVEQALAGAGCDVDYAADVEPWLGMRFAVAAVPSERRPDPVLVLQVEDAAAADAGLAELSRCGDAGDEVAWVVSGDWAVVAETDEIARSTAEAAAESSLADDETHRRWVDAAGDPGVLTAYAAPAAGMALMDLLGGGTPLGSPLGPQAPLGTRAPVTTEELGAEDAAASGSAETVPSTLEESLQDFGGAAATVRFADGTLEVEGAGAAAARYAGDGAGEAVGALPEDTALALGVALEEGWAGALVDALETRFGDDVARGLALAESELGLELPGDLETLLGESTVVALGGDVDVRALADAKDASEVPVGGRIRGDAAAVEAILEKLRAAAGPEDGQVLGTDSAGDVVAVGPDDDYRQRLLAGGELGSGDAFEEVVPDAGDAAAVLYADFDAGDWLVGLAREAGDEEVAANLDPLRAAGLRAWAEDDVGHALLRLTTE